MRIGEDVAFLSHLAGQNGGLHHCSSAQKACGGHLKLFLQVAQLQRIKLSEHGLGIWRLEREFVKDSEIPTKAGLRLMEKRSFRLKIFLELSHLSEKLIKVPFSFHDGLGCTV